VRQPEIAKISRGYARQILLIRAALVQLALPVLIAVLQSQQAGVAAPIADSVVVKKDVLKVGDPAPPLTVLQWLKGHAVPRFEKGRLYVVDFAATWCAPCRKSIPHLTELARRYADKVTLVSVFVLENHKEENSDDIGYVDKVNYLIKAMGDKMDYAIAVDVPQQTTARDWKIHGVPLTVVVNRAGDLAWIGQPEELDVALEKIETGTFQAEAAGLERKALQASVDEILLLKQHGEYRQALAKVDPLIVAHPENAWLYSVKYQILAGYDDARANALLKWLLNSDMPGFDWDHLVANTYTLSKHPDYRLALTIVDRAIAKAETKLVTANLLEQKSDIYLSRSQSSANAVEGRSDRSKAVEALEQAVTMSRAPGIPHDERLENSLRYHQFKLLAGFDDTKANALLRSTLNGRARKVDWLGFIDTALQLQRSPDYGLLLAMAEQDWIEAEKVLPTQGGRRYYDARRAEVLSRKADVYAAQGDLSRALTASQQALEAERKAGTDSEGLERFERKLADLKERRIVQPP
jgi:thiol-disulfide isomerase/thioredoxin